MVTWNSHHDEIAPEWRREDNDPVHDRSPYSWLPANGYSGMNYALREHHEITVKEFFINVIYHTDDQDSEGYDWGIDDKETIDRLDNYLRAAGSKRQGLSDSTINSRRSRLATYVQAYNDLHGSATIVDAVVEIEDQPEEIQRVLTIFDVLFEDLAPASQQK